MTNANMQFAVLEVDADAPENASVNPELEVGFLHLSIIGCQVLLLACLTCDDQSTLEGQSSLLYIHADEMTVICLDSHFNSGNGA